MTADNPSSRLFTVDQHQGGQRLDIFLPQNDPSLSRSQVKRAIEEGDVLVNGLAPKPSQRLKEGDIIRLTLRPAQEAVALPQEIPLNIVYEDAAIIVVNKAGGNGCPSGAGQLRSYAG